MSFAERLRAIESRLETSEREREEINSAFERLCDVIGVKYNIIFKSDVLFDWEDFEMKEENTKSKEKLPPIAQIDGNMIEEKKKKGDQYE